MTRLAIISFLLFVFCALSTNAQTNKSTYSERRVALVIGNGSYATAPLKNPVNDSHDIGQALRELRFEVIDKENVNQNDMKRAIREFGQKIQNGDVALFYYAGHAV
jgi:uncharacterized caspase-like protein